MRLNSEVHVVKNGQGGMSLVITFPGRERRSIALSQAGTLKLHDWLDMHVQKTRITALNKVRLTNRQQARKDASRNY